MKLKTKIIISLLVFFIIVNVFIAIIFHSFTRKSIERDFIDSKTKLTEHYAYTVISTIVEKDVLKAETTLNNILKDNEILYIFITDFDNNKFIDKYSKNITPKRQKQISSFINSQKNSHIRRKIIESNILYIGIPIIEELDAYIYIGYSIKALNVLFIRQFLIFTITSVIIFILAIIFIFKFAYLITTPVTQLCNYMNLYAKYKLSLKDIKLKSYSIETDLLMNSFINMINDREK